MDAIIALNYNKTINNLEKYFTYLVNLFSEAHYQDINTEECFILEKISEHNNENCKPKRILLEI